MKAIAILLIPPAVLLVSACAPVAVRPGYAGPGPSTVYVEDRDHHHDNDGQNGYVHNQTEVNDVNVNRTTVNERTVNRTNVNQVNVNKKQIVTKGSHQKPAPKTADKHDQKNRQDDQHGNQ